MTIQIELALGRPQIVAGEDVPFTITVRNDGGADETVRDPALDADWPKLEVLDPTGFRAAYGGRTDREKHGHEFVQPPVPERVTLAPGDQASADAKMLRWVGPLAPGSYEVRLQLEADGIAVRSTKHPLEVLPLRATGVELVGPDAGTFDPLYAMATHREADGTASLLAWMHLTDDEGHLESGGMQRLGAVGPAPVSSVSRAGLPYPGQWIVWIGGGHLRGFFHMQGRPIERVDTALYTPTSLVGPVLTELEGCDGSAPPRGEVLLVEASRASVGTLLPDGSLAYGAEWPLDGALEWGRATLPQSNVREGWLALRRDGALEVVRLRWDDAQLPEAPEVIATARDARVLGGDLRIGADGGVYGALVTRRDLEEGPGEYELLRFGVSADGSPGAASTPIVTDPPRDFVRAIVGVRSDGAPYALAQAVGGAWWGATSEHLIANVDPGGEPLAVTFWLGAPHALVAVDAGVAYRELPR